MATRFTTAGGSESARKVRKLPKCLCLTVGVAQIWLLHILKIHVDHFLDILKVGQTTVF